MIDQDFVERYRAAHEREQRGAKKMATGRSEWIEASLEEAELLGRKRGEVGGDDTFFGKWLDDNGVRTLHTDNERQALIRLSANLDLARDVLQKTERTSFHNIWYKEAEARYATSHMGMGGGVGAPQSNHQSLRDGILRLAKERSVEGITSVEADIELKSGSATKRCSDLAKDGLLIRTKRKRRSILSPATSAVYVYHTFATVEDRQPNRRAKKQNRASAAALRTGPVERVQHETLKPDTITLTPEELGKPAPEIADEPDPERPGLTRAQGHVAQWGQVQIIPIKDRKKSIMRRLHSLMRELDKPLTDYIEQAAILITAADIAELLPTMENPDRIRDRITAALAAVEGNAVRFVQHIQSLKTVFDNQPETETETQSDVSTPVA